MQDDKLSRLLHRFAAAAIAHNQAMEEMAEERANAHAQIIAGLHRSILLYGENGKRALLLLMDDDNPVVAGMAAVHLLGYDTPRCLAVLERVAQEPGLLGFRAKAAIERWESGDWQEP